VLAGEDLLIVESEERTLRAWDYAHTPPDTPHVLVAAGTGPFVYVAAGSRSDAPSRLHLSGGRDRQAPWRGGRRGDVDR
jgi:hypothetical protein